MTIGKTQRIDVPRPCALVIRRLPSTAKRSLRRNAFIGAAFSATAISDLSRENLASIRIASFRHDRSCILVNTKVCRRAQPLQIRMLPRSLGIAGKDSTRLLPPRQAAAKAAEECSPGRKSGVSRRKGELVAKERQKTSVRQCLNSPEMNQPKFAPPYPSSLVMMNNGFISKLL